MPHVKIDRHSKSPLCVSYVTIGRAHALIETYSRSEADWRFHKRVCASPEHTSLEDVWEGFLATETAGGMCTKVSESKVKRNGHVQGLTRRQPQDRMFRQRRSVQIRRVIQRIVGRDHGDLIQSDELPLFATWQDSDFSVSRGMTDSHASDRSNWVPRRNSGILADGTGCLMLADLIDLKIKPLMDDFRNLDTSAILHVFLLVKIT